MITLRIITVALGYIVGIVLASQSGIHPPAWITGAIALIGLAWAIYLIVQEKKWVEHPRWLIIASVLAFAVPLGWMRTSQFVAADTTGTLAGYLDGLDTDDDQPDMVELAGHVVNEPELISGWRGDLVLEADRVRRPGQTEWTHVTPGRVKIRWYRPWPGSPQEAVFTRLFNPDAYGYQVQALVHFKPPDEPMNPGVFDYAAFMQAEDLIADLAVNERYASRDTAGAIEITEETSGNPLMELALEAKKSFLMTFKQTIPEPASRLVSATTLGTRNALRYTEIEGDRVPDIFRHAGVGHVLAVSGLHVTIITVLIYGLLRLVRLPTKVAAPVCIFLLILFTLLTGARPSTVRAAIMNSVILIALAYFKYGLTGATFIGLSVSSFFILLQKPLVLFGPAFLLSFGAVLSLVLITPPLDRWLLRLRGASLVGAVGWFVGVYILGCVAWPTLIRWEVLLLAVAALWALISLGSLMNQQLPILWKVGLEKIPTPIRIFLVAQLGINIGMMIPMSAWFFGQFPIAGIFVNLAAIPLVGVIVQLGVLTGLAGMIPFVGIHLASAFGAADAYAADLFFWIAHRATLITPFPAAPKPTVGWMIGYYGVLGLLLFVADPRFSLFQNRLYRWARRPALAPAIPVSAWVAPILIALTGLVGLALSKPHVDRVTILHGNGVPTLTIAGSPAAVINPGNWRTASGPVFESLRTQGIVQIDHAILGGIDPRTGISGLPPLAQAMPVRTAHLPIVANPLYGYPYAIQDSYLMDKLSVDARWAVDYFHEYDDLLAAQRRHGFELSELPAGPVLGWTETAAIDTLNDGTTTATKYTSASRGRIIRFTYRGFRFLIITETTAAQLRQIAGQADPTADILLLPQVHISNKNIYEDTVRAALDLAQPRLVIVCEGNDRARVDPPPDGLFRPDPDTPVIRTSRTGALTIEVENDTLRLTGYVIPPGADQPTTVELRR